jgi:hypothetical protein
MNGISDTGPYMNTTDTSNILDRDNPEQRPAHKNDELAIQTDENTPVSTGGLFNPCNQSNCHWQFIASTYGLFQLEGSRHCSVDRHMMHWVAGTGKLMASKGIWWSLQPFVEDGHSPFADGTPNRIKQQTMYSGTDNAYAMARKHGIKTAWGTDILFSAENAKRQNEKLTLMTRWYKPAEVLRMATSLNAELLALSGERSPYPGKLGVVAEGALADMLLVDGDPLSNIELLNDPATKLVLIIKDGKVVKDIR